MVDVWPGRSTDTGESAATVRTNQPLKKPLKEDDMTVKVELPPTHQPYLERGLLPADFYADGRYRSIDITAPTKDLQVRARKGYYAPRQ